VSHCLQAIVLVWKFKLAILGSPIISYNAINNCINISLTLNFEHIIKLW
jgi:hypothetical protein